MSARETIDTDAQAASGRIDVDDVDELQQVLQPWDVVLRQMSSGKLHARMDYVQVNGILLYREHWSHRILGTGATPPGVFLFGGRTSSQSQACWCGIELGADRLDFARSSAEIDFATPDAETHVCLLVPEDLMLHYLGEEFVMRGLPNEPFLACADGGGMELFRTIERILDNYSVHRDLLANERTRRAIEWRLMGGWWSSCSPVANAARTPELPEPPDTTASSAVQSISAMRRPSLSASPISRTAAA
jgi:hypothetical protein